MTKRKMENEYFSVLTTVRIEQKTDLDLKATVKELDISQSTFIRRAIQDAIAGAGVV